MLSTIHHSNSDHFDHCIEKGICKTLYFIGCILFSIRNKSLGAKVSVSLVVTTRFKVLQKKFYFYFLLKTFSTKLLCALSWVLLFCIFYSLLPILEIAQPSFIFLKQFFGFEFQEIGKYLKVTRYNRYVPLTVSW